MTTLTKMTITEALAIDERWHGVEPCADCGVTHTPVWLHVDFDSDHPQAAELRRQRNALVGLPEPSASVDIPLSQ